MADGPFIVPQFFDNSGNPLNAGKVYTYLTGTSTLSSSYSDSGITSANANPLVLASTGRGKLWLDPAINYDVVIKTSADVTLDTVTNVSGDGRIASTFTASLSGCTASVTGTARYTKYAGIVTLYLPALSGTSNTTSMAISGLPSAIFPARAQHVPIPQVTDNTTKYNLAKAVVNTSDTIDLYFSAAITTDYGNTFTGSGTKGLQAVTTITYSLV